MAQGREGTLDLAKARRWALIDTRHGKHPRRVVEMLIERGLSEPEALRLVAAATAEVAAARIAAGRRLIFFGTLTLVPGLWLTISSFLRSGGGGGGVLFYGMVVAGGVQLGGGLAQIRRWRARAAGADETGWPSALGARRR